MAKGIYIGVNDKARKVKKCYIGVDGIARKVKKAYIGVDGVAQLVYTCGDTWRKYTASAMYRPAWYDQDDLSVGSTYATTEWYDKPFTTNFCEGYSFGQSVGFKGGANSPSGRYSVSPTMVYDMMYTIPQDETDTKIQMQIVWQCVASATYYPEQYTYTKDNYVGEVYAEEGQYPTFQGYIVHMENGCVYTYENGSYYCYEKVIE